MKKPLKHFPGHKIMSIILNEKEKESKTDLIKVCDWAVQDKILVLITTADTYPPAPW